MKIAILASNLIRLPPEPEDIPQGYSGAPERIMSVITEALCLRGHDVTLFASGDSKTRAQLISVTNKATALDPMIGTEKHVDFEYYLMSRCYQMANTGEFDVIHTSFDMRSSFFAPFSSVPTVVTLHSPLDGIRNTILHESPSSQWYVSISNAQRRLLPELQYIDTIYHGIDDTVFIFQQEQKKQLLCVGRITQKKGTKDAVLAARATGLSISLLGEAVEGDSYWKDDILPFIDQNTVLHKGMVDMETLLLQYQQAKALLFPICWEEPFGLVMIEAMACGTPVIAYNRGSVPEIVKDGVTGFIIDPDDADRPGKGSWVIKKQGIEGLVEAVKRIGEIDRLACRKHVEKHFTIKIMIDGYEAVYKKVLAQR